VTDQPEQTPEGRLIQDAAIKDGRSIRQLAAKAGISDTRWRHIVKGFQPLGGGRFNPIIAPAGTLARMAEAVGLDPDDLDRVGRSDAAKWLAGVQEARERTGRDVSVNVQPAEASAQAHNPARSMAEVEDLILASDLSDAKKVQLIRDLREMRSQIPPPNRLHVSLRGEDGEQEWVEIAPDEARETA